MKPAIRIDAYEQGVKAERERIVALLQAWLADDDADFDDTLAQVKGQFKVYYWCLCGHKSGDSWQEPNYQPVVHCPSDNQRMVRVVRGL